MQRYQLVVQTTDRGTLRSQASNREMADAMFKDAAEALKPGESVTLTDTKGEKQLNHRYKPTAEERLEELKRYFFRWLEGEEATQQAMIDFAEQMKADFNSNDATYQLRWGDKVFETCARLQVSKEVRHLVQHQVSVKPDVDLPELLRYCTEKALYGAQHPERSTSACSNLMHQYMTSAYAKAAERITNLLTILKENN